jgi:hypothetical protein
MLRREARAAKAEAEKNKKEREVQREQQKRDRENRKGVEQRAVDLRVFELHVVLISANERKRDDDESPNSPVKRSRKGREVELEENG